MVSINDFPFLSSRDPESYKGDYGHALLVAGSYGKMGAAVLAARACLRAGAGLLTVHTPRCGVEILQTAVPEAMISIDEDRHCFSSLPAQLERYDAIAVGPGLGTGDATQNALLNLLRHRPAGSLVLDADALNILAQHPESLHLASGAVITPHKMEYRRLFGDAEPQQMADLHNLVIVGKAHRTQVFAPHSKPIANATGNAGMATAGSGDVLTGIALGLTAQAVAYTERHKDFEFNINEPAMVQQIAALAVRLHGEAGDRAAAQRMQPSVIASDIVDAILL